MATIHPARSKTAGWGRDAPLTPTPSSSPHVPHYTHCHLYLFMRPLTILTDPVWCRSISLPSSVMPSPLWYDHDHGHCCAFIHHYYYFLDCVCIYKLSAVHKCLSHKCIDMFRSPRKRLLGRISSAILMKRFGSSVKRGGGMFEFQTFPLRQAEVEQAAEEDTPVGNGKNATG